MNSTVVKWTLGTSYHPIFIGYVDYDLLFNFV
jgi:hypothetical protein